MAENLFPWLSEVDLAAQYLTSLTLSTAAQVAMIIRAEELWAYAGELSQPAIQELLKAVIRHWADGGGKDFAQFVALESTGNEYLLYATRLEESMLLVLAFDVEVPFSKIRSQANRLASALKAPPGSSSLEHDDLESEANQTHIRLEPLFPLHDVPPPTPSLVAKSDRDIYTNPQQHNRVDTYRLQKDNGLLEIATSGRSEVPEDDSSREHIHQSAIPVDIPDDSTPTGIIAKFVSKNEDPSGEKVSALIKDMDLQLPKSEVVIPQFNISYAFLLVPRLPSHHLTGELALALEGDMRQLAIAFGWKVQNLMIDSEYFQWIARVLPNTSPSRLVRLIREHSSKRLFSRFPHLERDNPSGDFWAPGYLVMSSNQPLPAHIVNSFVQQIRFNQGAAG
ncbi:MAG TPA: transposase [Anaerolineales bacterium]|nr:transposase [Anaerolineales bacterium]